MEELVLTQTQLARLVEYQEVTVHVGDGRYVRVKVRATQASSLNDDAE